MLPPAILTIFGITGDLAQRKLLPALYHLTAAGLLGKQHRIVGVTRRGISAAELVARIQQSVEAQGETCNQATLATLAAQIEIATLDLLTTKDYRKLGSRLDEIEQTTGTCLMRVFYLAIPSQIFAPVVEQLGRSGLNAACPHGIAPRLLIEKPFGYDLTSAQELIAQVGTYFDEPQIYRIDHYLAKASVQQLVLFRTTNQQFAKLWNRDHIQRITITAAESIGIEGRGTFYDQTGALRDFLQSHLLQLLALVAMEPPASSNATALHQAKLTLLQAIEPIAPNTVVTRTMRGQYEGYKTDAQNPGSITETYAALRLTISNPRWHGVPIILRTGKALAKKCTEIVITFKEPRKALTLYIEPADTNGVLNLASPTLPGDVDYERVLNDALCGDKTLFTTSKEVIASWRIIEHVLDEWAKNTAGLQVYAKGSLPLELT